MVVLKEVLECMELRGLTVPFKMDLSLFCVILSVELPSE